MTVKEIVANYLKENKFNGLWVDTGESEGCGCRMDDLFPCSDESCLSCRPGYYQDPENPDTSSIGPERVKGEKP